jgi:radical SAM PhpK family P-methyltransferase
MSASIDCVVVGYNDTNFDDLLARNEPFRDRSGGYRHLIANSAMLERRRLKYFDLLNLARSRAGLGPSRLHVAKMPNLGVYYLVSYLRRLGLGVEYVNFFNDEQDHFRDLLSTSPGAVAITTTFYFEAEPICEIIDFVRQHSPQTKTIVGGPHVFNICSDHPIDVQDTLFREIGADVYVFDSQGELTLTRLCIELRTANPRFELIPNVIVKEDDGTFRRSSRAVENNDLNVNAIDWSQFDSEVLRPTVQTRTARSCAYKCAFCRYPIMAGNLDLMSLDSIERELDYLDRVGIRHVLFIDDTFNVPVQRFKEICRLMIRKQYGFRWFSYFRCANADDECFDLMAAAGCMGVFLGIESGDDRILKAMNKVASVEKYMKGIRELNARDIITYASFIVGHPPETDETAANTLAFIESAKPTFYCLETFFFDPKVPIGSRSAEFGLTGSGYAWRHHTMGWRRASDIVEHGYRTLTGSTVLPLYGFDLWSLAYLMAQGISREQLTAFLRLASKLMVDSLASDGKAPGIDLDQLANVFASNVNPRESGHGASLHSMS